ncbi:MAG TPA: hypothetical protein VHN58_06310 [Croceicoccus sp.]|nr:hypothetical protein [Croceicoccus sp.]
MAGLSAAQIGVFIYIVATQIVGIAFLVKTRGFTQPGWTAATIAILVSSFFAMSWLLENGAKLNILFPVLSAVVPLCTVMVGIFVYGEAASATRIGLLVGACVLIGAASAVG